MGKEDLCHCQMVIRECTESRSSKLHVIQYFEGPLQYFNRGGLDSVNLGLKK
jgi:hypothetical protein